MMITVFTPTYNRAHLLGRLYNSLREQSYKDFEWLIVDDGSTDNTSQLIGDIIEKNNQDFCIRYFRVNNGGKHRAINYAVSKAQGEAFFVVDSDDWLPKDSLENVWGYFNEIKNDERFAGVAGLKGVGEINFKQQTFEGEYLDATSIERKKYGIFGEKAEVFKTEILKKYPFPEYEGEKFISEAIVWNKIAYDGLMLRWFNRCVYIYEYQDDGLTRNLYKKYQESPIGYLTYVRQEMSFGGECFFKKYMFYGRCLRIVKKSTLTPCKARQILGINAVQALVAGFFWVIYAIVKK